MSAAADRATRFRALHSTAAPLALVNAWDVGSAKVMAAAGAPAIGTTSAGVSWAHGLPDGERLSRDAMLAVVAAICAAVDVPVTADVEGGYGDVAGTVRLAIAAGAVGFNLEDSHPDGSLWDLGEHLDRLAAARAAIAASGVPAFLNARVDALWLSLGTDVALVRARAYAEAGADGIFVPGAVDPEALCALADAAAPAAFNVLALPGLPPLADLGRLGLARVSSGSGPVRTALSLAHRATREALESGTFAVATSGELSY